MDYIIEESGVRQKNCCQSYLILAVIILATLAVYLLHYNAKLFLLINSWHVFLPNSVWNFINTLAAPKLFILPVLLVLLTALFRREQLKRLAVLLLSFYVWFFLLKKLIHEARPFVVLPKNSMFLLLNHQDTLHNLYVAFPSGHTGMAAIFSFTLIRIFSIRNRVLGFILFLFPVIVGITRIATGWHWPVDVLASGIIAYIMVQLFFCRSKCNIRN